jgi:hypothetical protein
MIFFIKVNDNFFNDEPTHVLTYVHYALTFEVFPSVGKVYMQRIFIVNLYLQVTNTFTISAGHDILEA